MSDESVFASSAGKTLPDSVTFEVSDHFLESHRLQLDVWSEPVRFRFERRSDGGWDLVMQTHESRYEDLA